MPIVRDVAWSCQGSYRGALILCLRFALLHFDTGAKWIEIVMIIGDDYHVQSACGYPNERYMLTSAYFCFVVAHLCHIFFFCKSQCCTYILKSNTREIVNVLKVRPSILPVDKIALSDCAWNGILP